MNFLYLNIIQDTQDHFNLKSHQFECLRVLPANPRYLYYYYYLFELKIDFYSVAVVLQ
jgi:hypothetical protein